MSQTMEQEIIAFIKKEYVEDEDEAESLTAQTALIKSGLIDSFSIVAIRNWVQKKYNVTIPDALGTVDNFQSVKKIVELVTSRQKA